MLRFNDVLERLTSYNPHADIELLKKAYVFSAKVPLGQVRLSGEPYLTHPLEVANILAGQPDFVIDLGDTFMSEKHASRDSGAKQYASQRFHLGLVGHSAAVFLVLGNHDGEMLDRAGGVPGCAGGLPGLAQAFTALRAMATAKSGTGDAAGVEELRETLAQIVER